MGVKIKAFTIYCEERNYERKCSREYISAPGETVEEARLTLMHKGWVVWRGQGGFTLDRCPDCHRALGGSGATP